MRWIDMACLVWCVTGAQRDAQVEARRKELKQQQEVRFFLFHIVAYVFAFCSFEKGA
jgi:hypothetical protein